MIYIRVMRFNIKLVVVAQFQLTIYFVKSLVVITSKKQKVCSLYYRHPETTKRKGSKRGDLFYGGEWDKPTISGEI